MIYLLDGLNWYSFVDRYGRLFSEVIEALNGFVNFMVKPLSDLLVNMPSLNPGADALVDGLLYLFGHLSLVEVCIGGGITLFIIITVIKWIIGIVM